MREGLLKAVEWFNSPDNAALANLLGDALIALAAVVGVLITALFATNQYRKEREEKRKDRALEIRKAVIVDGIRAVSTVSNHLFSLTSAEVDNATAISNFQSSIGNVNAACAVASVKTARIGRRFIDSIGPIFVVALSRRQNMMNHHQESLLAGSMADNQHEMNSRIFDEQRVLMTRRDADSQHAVKVLQGMFNSGNRYHADSVKEVTAAREQQEQERLKLAARLRQEMPRYLLVGHQLIAAFRQDMDIPGVALPS